MGLRIRPATGLCVILAIAFALELIAVLSVPVTRSITLCTYQNIQFGVFGYCNTWTNTCSDIGIGYGDVTSVEGFSLPSNARHTLANLLIVHVVAAGLTFILLLLTLAAHLQTFAHSSHYLLFILILSLPCFMLSLLAFLVDILLFVPHLDWGGWIVLAATVLIVLFGVLLCIMRRTISSRRATKSREDNSELQTLNYFNSSSAFVPDGGMVYGGETVHKTPHSDFVELRYNSRGTAGDNDDQIPLNVRSREHNNTQPDTAEEPHFYPAGVDVNSYDPYNNRTPSPSLEYRSPEYTDHAEFRDGSSSWNNNTPGAPNYSNQRSAPSAVAAAAATAGTVGGTTVAMSQGPGRRARHYRPSVTESIIPAGMSYGQDEYDDGASVAPDSYKEFGGNVVPIPRIHNYSALNPQSQSQADPRLQRSGSSEAVARSTPRQRNIVGGVNTQPSPMGASSSTLPTQYETAAESSSSLANSTERFPPAQGRSELRHAGPSPNQYSNPNAPAPVQRAPPQQQSPTPGVESTGQYNQRQKNPRERLPRPQQENLQAPPPVEYQEAQQQRASPSRHQDLRAMYVPEDRVTGDDHALPVLDNSHLQTSINPHSDPALDPPSSPAVSDSSHFTSISQRPVNPKYFQQPASNQRAASERTDFVLSNNPDFQIPGMSSAKRGKGHSTAAPQAYGVPRARPGKQRNNLANVLNVPGASSGAEGPYGASRGI